MHHDKHKHTHIHTVNDQINLELSILESFKDSKWVCYRVPACCPVMLSEPCPLRRGRPCYSKSQVRKQEKYLKSSSQIGGRGNPYRIGRRKLVYGNSQQGKILMERGLESGQLGKMDF